MFRTLVVVTLLGIAPGTASAKSAPVASSSAEIDWEATLEDYGPFALGGFGLFLVVFVVRARRAGRRRKMMENRRTQFGMTAIDPRVAEFHRAAFERAPSPTPSAIDPSPIVPSVIAPIPPIAQMPTMPAPAIGTQPVYAPPPAVPMPVMVPIAPPPSPRRVRMAEGSQQPPFAGLGAASSPTTAGAPQQMIGAVQARPVAKVMYPFETIAAPGAARSPGSGYPEFGAAPGAARSPGSGYPEFGVAQPAPAAYPLSFAAAELLQRKTCRGHAAVGPTDWDVAPTDETDAPADSGRDFVVSFARGSQDDELETTRARMKRVPRQ